MRYFAALALVFGVAVAALVPMASAQTLDQSAANRVQAMVFVRDNGIWQLRAPSHDGN